MFFSELDTVVQEKIFTKIFEIFKDEYHNVVLGFFSSHYPEMIDNSQGMERFEDIYAMVFVDSIDSLTALIARLLHMNDALLKKSDEMSIEINFNIKLISEKFVKTYFPILSLEIKKHISTYIQRQEEDHH